MTQRILLIRHAKSSWGDLGLSDRDRKLNGRGRKAAPAIGRWLADNGYLPDLMLVSDAARTMETAGLILGELPGEPTVIYRGNLYLASPDVMLAALRSETAGTIALIGHNPGIAILAEMLVAAPPHHSRFADYPTGAATVLDFADEVRPGAGTCVDFAIPADVM